MNEAFAEKMSSHVRQGTCDYVWLDPFANWGPLTTDSPKEPTLYQKLVEEIAHRSGRPLGRVRSIVSFRPQWSSSPVTVPARYLDGTLYKARFFWGPVWFSTSHDWLICRAAHEVLAEFQAECVRKQAEKPVTKKNQLRRECAA